MDAEQQVRLNFLEEADECCDRIETSILGISNSVADPSKLDLALRSSHSIKGGAAMMSYSDLSSAAHRLEDFLKILRVRYSNQSIETDVETLVLQSVDRLRELSGFYRGGQAIDQPWIESNLSPLFSQLHDKLGELKEEDENILLNQKEDVDPALLMFEEGVDAILDDFDTKLTDLPIEKMAQVLEETSLELINFGYMAELDPFIELCNFITAEAKQTPEDQLQDLTHKAANIWRRSHALVMRGSLDKLPNTIDNWVRQDSSQPSASLELESDVNLELDPAAFESSLDDLPDLAEFGDLGLEDLQAEFSGDLLTPEIQVPEIQAPAIEEPAIAEMPVEETSSPISEEVPEIDMDAIVDPFESLSFDADLLESLQDEFDQAIELPEIPEATEETPQTRILEPIVPAVAASEVTTGKTVKIAADQLQQFNTLFSKLVLERNAVTLRLDQIKEFSDLLRRRISQLSQSNTQLRKWYDRASMEGVIPQTNAVASSLTPASNNLTEGFDALEMDQYSDLHLISQSQIETVVQLEEVTSDIEAGLRAMEKAVQDLRNTTQLLQRNVTQTQMSPFEDAVKRFPRVIRDLNLKFEKSVNLIIEGQNTPIDRAILDTLSDALLHLLRNAFDHGIEGETERLLLNKPAQGTIRLRAENRSNETVITLEDDGSGIKLHKIRDRLMNLGFEAAEVGTMQDSELMDFIFEPGFSTASTVTEVSGRGVGMDLVRSNLNEIRGQITVSSQEGKGTVFSLKVPYSLSIMKVLLMERAGIFLAMPIDSVREVIRLPETQDISQGLFTWNNQELPVVSLENYLQLKRPQQKFEMMGNPVINQTTMIIVGREQNLSAIALDRFWGEQEVTIRPISNALPLPAGFNSSLVMGDGRVLPLIDPIELVTWCQEQAPIESTAEPLTQTEFSESNTILVVDDSINVRKILTITLERAGYRVEQAKDGQDAVDQLGRGLQVNAVICDIEMPRLDGYGFLEEVKGNSDYENLPVFMLTSRSNEKHRKVAMNLGATDYFSKPFNEAQLLEQLNHVITSNKV